MGSSFLPYSHVDRIRRRREQRNDVDNAQAGEIYRVLREAVVGCAGGAGELNECGRGSEVAGAG